MTCGAPRPRGPCWRTALAVTLVAASVTASPAAEPSLAVGPASAGAPALPGAAALVVMSGAGLAPAHLRVPPGTPVLWLNRAPQSALAITFGDAFADSLDRCAGKRGFHAVPGHGPFTLMLVPGAVAVLCAPGAPGRYPYAVHGELAFDGVVDVLDVSGVADRRTAP